MNARGTRLLRDSDDRFFCCATILHHQVSELINDDHNERQPIVLIFATLIICGDVSRASFGEEAVAVLHLEDRPAQCGGRFLGFCDHRDEQVRQAVISGELNALRINKDETEILRSRTE